MVRAGVGISVVPTLTLYQFGAPELVTRPLRWPGLERSIYLVRRRERALSFAASAFYDCVMSRRPEGRRAAPKSGDGQPSRKRRQCTPHPSGVATTPEAMK